MKLFKFLNRGEGYFEVNVNFDVDPAECSQLPPFIANGVITGSGFLHGSLYTLKCQDGYSLIGQEILHCTENGTWNASFPVCLRGKSHDPVTIFLRLLCLYWGIILSLCTMSKDHRVTLCCLTS